MCIEECAAYTSYGQTPEIVKRLCLCKFRTPIIITSSVIRVGSCYYSESFTGDDKNIYHVSAALSFVVPLKRRYKLKRECISGGVLYHYRTSQMKATNSCKCSGFPCTPLCSAPMKREARLVSECVIMI